MSAKVCKGTPTLSPYLDKMSETCNDRIITNALRVFDCKNRSCQSLYENYALNF